MKQRPTLPFTYGPLLAAALLLSAATAAADPFGIVAHIPGETISDEIAEAGIEWVRVDFLWAIVELRQDEFDWRVYDELLDTLEARNLKVFATLQATPQWATDGVEFSGVPRDPADWKDFCYRAARRYRGRVHAWGLWNEANMRRFWQGTRNEYIQQILIEGARSLRAADPLVLICGPDLAHLNSANWDSWLDQVIAQAGDYLDVITHHTYPSTTGASNVTDKLESSSQWPWDPPPVRTVLDRRGWTPRPVWLTETGVASGSYGEAVQERFYTDLLQDWFPAARDRRWLDRIFFYEMVDDPRYDESFGILAAPPELTRKLAYDAYQSFTQCAVMDDAELRAMDVPRFIDPTGPTTLTVAFTNAGQTTWYAGEHQLDVATDMAGWTLSGGAWAGGHPVLPGETARFTMQLAGPTPWFAQPVFDLRIFARMKRSDQWYFGSALTRSLRVSSHPPATILVGPRSQAVAEGGTARLAVTAISGGLRLSYRWRRNSVNLNDGPTVEGSRSPTLVLSNVDAQLEGDYECVISSYVGSVYSRAAEIRVAELGGPTDPPRRGRDRYAPARVIRETLRRFHEKVLYAP